MSLVGKLGSEMEINIPAEKFYKIFKDECFQVPNLCPNLIQNIEVHEGNLDTHCQGSIKTWNYTIDGKVEVFKDRVEFDDKNLILTSIALEGDVFEHYKTWKTTIHVVPMGPNHSLAVLTLEYEKHDGGCPCPYKYLDLMNKITKDIESHLK